MWRGQTGAGSQRDRQSHLSELLSQRPFHAREMFRVWRGQTGGNAQRDRQSHLSELLSDGSLPRPFHAREMFRVWRGQTGAGSQRDRQSHLLCVLSTEQSWRLCQVQGNESYPSTRTLLRLLPSSTARQHGRSTRVSTSKRSTRVFFYHFYLFLNLSLLIFSVIFNCEARQF